MTKETAWNHLPNAVHIDRIVASVKAHPEEWYAAWHAAGYAARYAALNAALNAAWHAAGAAARYAALDPARDAAGAAAKYAAGGAAGDAIAALIAWDDCAKYLDMPSDKLRVWRELSEEPACILLLPAVTAFEKINILELA